MTTISAKVLAVTAYQTKATESRPSEPRWHSHLLLTQDLGFDVRTMKVWYWGKTELKADQILSIDPNEVEFFEDENANGKFVTMKMKRVAK
jgi:hypothetical protein